MTWVERSTATSDESEPRDRYSDRGPEEGLDGYRLGGSRGCPGVGPGGPEEYKECYVLRLEDRGWTAAV